MTENQKRLLIVRLSSAGDIIFALPLLNALREALPTAHIAWLVSNKFRDLLAHHPGLDEIIDFDRKGGAISLAKTIGKIRQRKFDIVLDLQNQWRSGIVTGLSGAKRKLGFAAGVSKEPNFIFTNQRVRVELDKLHNVERFLGFGRTLGIPEEILQKAKFSSNLSGGAEAQRYIDKFIQAKQPYIGAKPIIALSIAGSLVCKRWPEEKWSELIRKLLERGEQVPLIIWGPGEEEILERIRKQHGDRLLVAPRTDWKQLIELLRRVSVVIGNDSGPLHIAAHLGKRVIGLYGPSSVLKNGPFGVNNTGLRKDLKVLDCYEPDTNKFDATRCSRFRTCTMQRCIDLIEIEDVLQALTVH